MPPYPGTDQYPVPPSPPRGTPPGGHPAAGSRRPAPALVALGAVLVVALLAGPGWFAYHLYERSQRTVALLAADEPGDDPFGPSLVTAGTVRPVARFDAATNHTPTGTLDGLYLETRGSSACNVARLGPLLQGDPTLADAWAAPLGITAAGVPAYLTELTPVRLRADTRLTAHGYAGGRADPYPATLEAGTAVLVDTRGEPKVRCADVAPLTVAAPLADPYYADGWSGFDRDALVEIRPALSPAREFGLVDAVGQQPFRRPAGTAGRDDVAQLPDTGRPDRVYLFDGSQVACEGIQDCTRTQRPTLLLVPRFQGCPASCVVTDLDLGDRVAVTREGSTWRVTGTMRAGRGVGCQGGRAPTSYDLRLTPTASDVVNGVWTATSLRAEYQVRTPQFGGCVPTLLAFSLTGIGGR